MAEPPVPPEISVPSEPPVPLTRLESNLWIPDPKSEAEFQSRSYHYRCNRKQSLAESEQLRDGPCGGTGGSAMDSGERERRRNEEVEKSSEEKNI
ncbi:unnamed protein product [Arabidopsis lyrata]|nr:unnamed protein product [Arabidopsis lyrata]